ncbi:MAG: hypothetical protein EBT43_05815 [Methylocystaceae bacterium]|jgi:hypothetical protein|nr:hypothetical protein [Methylocystaceae bacterium]
MNGCFMSVVTVLHALSLLVLSGVALSLGWMAVVVLLKRASLIRRHNNQHQKRLANEGSAA